MPTNRKRKSRKFVASTISESMRYFLETGDYCLRKLFPDDPRGRAEIFRLAYSSPRMRDELRRAWLLHRPEILRHWKVGKRKGLPWAAKQFDVKEATK